MGPSVSPPYLTTLATHRAQAAEEAGAGVIWRAFPLAMQGLRGLGKGEAQKPPFSGAA